MKKITLLFCFLFFLASNSFAQIELVKDLVTTDGDSWPSDFIKGNGFTVFNYFGASTQVWASDGTPSGTVEIGKNIPEIFNVSEASGIIGTTLFFVIGNSNTGDELYKTDGTLAGTVLVKNINTNPNSGSNPNNFTVLNGKLYFTADDGFNGQQLWVTDGTEAGTTVLTANPIFPSNLITVNNAIYFTAEDANNGSELWKTDGTAAGTTLVKDINPGVNGSFISNLFKTNNTFFFIADNGANGTELWKSDGTEPGTTLVKDINPGNLSSFPSNFLYVNNLLYFIADNGTNGTEIWKSDGTEAGTIMLKDINPGATSTSINGILAFENSAVFLAQTNAEGLEPWISDGTPAGTLLLKDINPGAESGISQFGNINPVIFNGVIYFEANNGTNGRELWKSDGTEAGTSMVKDINTDTSVESGNGIVNGLYLINNKLIFSAFTTTSNIELWESDGTTAGTVLLKDINPNKGWGTSIENGSAISINNKLLFTANDGNSGYEPWVTDGTNAGTIQLKNLNNIPNGSNPSEFTIALNTLFFAADSTVFSNQRLWVTDGTALGTQKVNSIIGPKAITEYKGKIFLASSDFSNDYGIFSTDLQGTKELIKKINPNGQANITEFYHFTGIDELFFAADDGTNGKELWKTDGTEAGTILVKDLIPGADGNLSLEFFEFNNVLYFMALKSTGVSTSIKSIWKTDGTTAGTTLLKEFSNVNGSSNTPYFNIYNNKLYFTAFDNSTGGTHLWETDGTIAGTVAAYVGFNNPKNLVTIGNDMFIAASSGVDGQEMWKYDGTDATLFKGFAAGSTSGYYPSEKYGTLVNGFYYFSAYDGTEYSVWKTDGTLANTTSIVTIPNGGFLPDEVAVGSSFIYLTFDDGTNGYELWKSDGTVAGTTLVEDLYPGADDFGNQNSSNPKNLTILGTDLYFNATTNDYGTELFKLSNVVLATEDFDKNTFSTDLELVLYPNPTQDFIKINSKKASIKNIQIFNLLGKEVANYKKETLKQDTFDVSNLKAGIYLIKIYTNKGFVTKKFLKN